MMAEGDCNQMIDLVSDLLSKGFIVKLCEELENKRVQETLFKKKHGYVYAKGRNCRLKPIINNDGWEKDPLEFDDWWIDIIVDGLLKEVSVLRYDHDEHIIWNNIDGFIKKAHKIPPSTLIINCNADTRNDKQLTLKELSVLALRNSMGFQSILDIEYMLDTHTIKTAKSSVVWWVSL